MQKSRFFIDPTNSDNNERSIDKMTEPLYTIEIPESELKWFTELENAVFENPYGDYLSKNKLQIFRHLIDQKTNEILLRNKYPAVEKAFQTYSLLLHLCNKE